MQGSSQWLFCLEIKYCSVLGGGVLIYTGKIRQKGMCCSYGSLFYKKSLNMGPIIYQKILSRHSSVTRVTVEEKSNFKCITSGKVAFLSFDLPPILVEGLCMHGLIQKYFLHNWYFLRYHDLFDVTRVTGCKIGFLRSLDSNGFSIKPISVTKIIFAELGT